MSAHKKVYPEVQRRLDAPIPARKKPMTRQESRQQVTVEEWKALKRYPHPGTRQVRRAELRNRVKASA